MSRSYTDPPSFDGTNDFGHAYIQPGTGLSEEAGPSGSASGSNSGGLTTPGDIIIGANGMHDNQHTYPHHHHQQSQQQQHHTLPPQHPHHPHTSHTQQLHGSPAPMYITIPTNQFSTTGTHMSGMGLGPPSMSGMNMNMISPGLSSIASAGTDASGRAGRQSLPPSMASPSYFDDYSFEMEDDRKRKRMSLPENGGGFQDQDARRRGVTVQAPGGRTPDEETEHAGESRKKKGSEPTSASGSGSGSGATGLTSCEACRKGKRRCEPSPLVPPTHPDAAKLPCARCRRFALECVRVKVTRKKGPAPVDLSAISDAVHGFTAPGSNGQPPSAAEVPATSSAGNVEQLTAESRRTSSEQSQAYPFPNASTRPTSQSSSGFSPAYHILAVSPSLNMSALPDNLDGVATPSIIDNIINLFFDYVYPLTPCLHKPTFMANLAARVDKTDPIFFALVLAVLASTLVQVPRSLVNLEKNEVESLARRCVRISRAKMNFLWDEPVPVQSAFIVIAYLEGIVHLILGNNTAHVINTAEANQLALAMRLNEESSYEGLDPIESEIRRRIYWLLFQADKSAACMRARTMSLRLEDAAALRLPSEVDDENITAAGVLPQPQGRISIISGFNTVTNLFRILNDALLLQRRKAPPTVDSILADLQNVNELREKVLSTANNVPGPLKLRTAHDSRVNSPAQDWEEKLQARFIDYFSSAGDTPTAANSYLVQQGNILVTQHVIRLVLLQTKESLLQQLAAITQMPVGGITTLAGMQAGEPAEDIACELLDGLNSLPVECVATNGPSLVQKVRFVAIQLMECSVSPSPTTARAQKLLMQFLSVLSVIEGMYTFGRDISAE